MSNIAQQRIQREFREVVKSEEVTQSGVHLSLVNDDLTNLSGTILGPPDTPYEGGTYKLEISIPESASSPRSGTPNISSVTGAICLDILKDQWAAAMTLRTPQSRMTHKTPSWPSSTLKSLRPFSKRHALGLCLCGGTRLQLGLQEMGVDEAKARIALSSCSWDLHKATEQLFS
ncbi:Ubiquitin-conjugating enzyme E2-22kDa-like protein [Caligus rogercresseyi]|uniref:Ubiquitin-conjugating enzyme E2-22kDa-like protein n=1 Tax=Caligus rogercresseyi TaxID=217165 RepID=A0A7T8H2Q0_CALRO|nr:Ubiquitin-conjugating enzyme E2-22kDa-like protein [Caligus rogercresseyi]